MATEETIFGDGSDDICWGYGGVTVRWGQVIPHDTGFIGEDQVISQ